MWSPSISGYLIEFGWWQTENVLNGLFDKWHLYMCDTYFFPIVGCYVYPHTHKRSSTVGGCNYAWMFKVSSNSFRFTPAKWQGLLDWLGHGQGRTEFSQQQFLNVFSFFFFLMHEPHVRMHEIRIAISRCAASYITSPPRISAKVICHHIFAQHMSSLVAPRHDFHIVFIVSSKQM